MIGTIIIAVVGYGLALVLTYECIAFSWRSVVRDGLDGTGNALNALGAGGLAIVLALLTRWLIGGIY